MPRQRPLRAATFWFDGGQRVRAWTDGDTWNGWGVPLFDTKEFPALRAVLEEVGFRVERRGDTLRLTHRDDDHATDYLPERRDEGLFWRLDGLTWNVTPIRRGRRRSLRPNAPLRIPGWSVGYHDDIGAHAAVRELPRGQLLVMTADDREPRSLEEEVTVGLYTSTDDAWDLVGYQDFRSVREVLAVSSEELRSRLEP